VGGVETVERRITPALETATPEMLEFVVLIFTALQDVSLRVPC